MIQTTYDISVIICAYTEKRWDDLIAAVESVGQQTVQPREINIVIDYNAVLLKQAQEYLVDVIAIENRQGKVASGSRNSGVAIAQGTVVAFLDDDAFAEQVLGLFGHSYAEPAAWCLRILAVVSFPFIIKNHYLAVCRIQGRVAYAARVTVSTGTLELGGSLLGAYLGGLTGFSLGWFAAVCIEAVFMFRTVYRAARPVDALAGTDQLPRNRANYEGVRIIGTHANEPGLGQ